MKNDFNSKRSLFCLLLTAFLVSATSSSSLALTPSPVEPGIIIKGAGEEKRPPSRIEDNVPVPKEEKASQGLSAEKVFVLKNVVLEETVAYKGVDLSSLFEDMIGQKVSFADLNAIAQRVTKKYREEGYVFSRAVLSPQKVENGVVHLRAVEGHIDNVQVVGTFKDNNGTIKEMADKIRSAGPANTRQIERYLLLIDDLPGITAKSFIKPSKAQGGGDLIISVEEDAFEGSVGADNRGSKYIGPYRGTLVGAFNSLLGVHDRTTLRGIVTSQINEMKFADVTHEEQLGSEGMKVKARAAFTSTDPGGNISALGIQGDSQLYDLEGSYPVVRSRNYNLNLLGGLTALNSETDTAGIQTAQDHVRSVRAGATFDFIDQMKGVNQFDLQVTQGLDALGATNDGVGRSRANGEHKFLRGNLTGTRIQELAYDWSLMLLGTGQISSSPLLASEEFSVGGPTFGRAYDSGEITGDRGWAGVGELRYGGPVDNEILQSYQLYSFIDFGRVWNRSPVVGEAADDSLASAGLGVRFNLKKNISGYVEWNKPLNQIVASEGDQGSRLFFSVLMRF
ncbi:MAG: ShlB/FhaC/HecB family hemolysin secretion/activation protein [Pseudomonadota bacterium]